MRTITLLISCISLVAACTSDDSSAPTISNLTLAPSTVPVGQQVTISGTLAFEDPDGDADQLGMEVTLPDQTKQPIGMTKLQNVGSMTEGTISWAFIVVPPKAGSYELALWITDLDGHESNRLQGTATAQ